MRGVFGVSYHGLEDIHPMLCGLNVKISGIDVDKSKNQIALFNSAQEFWGQENKNIDVAIVFDDPVVCSTIVPITMVDAVNTGFLEYKRTKVLDMTKLVKSALQGPHSTVKRKRIDVIQEVFHNLNYSVLGTIMKFLTNIKHVNNRSRVQAIVYEWLASTSTPQKLEYVLNLVMGHKRTMTATRNFVNDLYMSKKQIIGIRRVMHQNLSIVNARKKYAIDAFDVRYIKKATEKAKEYRYMNKEMIQCFQR